jgi:hypothetical protein
LSGSRPSRTNFRAGRPRGGEADGTTPQKYAYLAVLILVCVTVIAVLWGSWGDGFVGVTDSPLEATQAEDRDRVPHNVLGRIARVELDADYQVGPPPLVWSPGEPGGGEFLVGPAVLELTDGRRLTVAHGTPGGNACPDLYVPESMRLAPGEEVDDWADAGGVPKPDACAIIGLVDPQDVLQWFVVLAEYDSRSGEAMLGAVTEQRDDVIAVEDGYTFPVAAQLDIRCMLGDYRDLAELVERRGSMQRAVLSVDRGEIVAVECIYED